MRNQQSLIEPARYAGEGFHVVRRLSDQTIVAGGYSDIALDTSLVNDNGCFNFGTSRYVCPKAGRMQINATCAVQNNTGGNLLFILVIVVVPSFFRGNALLVSYDTITPTQTKIASGSTWLDVEVGASVGLGAFVFTNNATAFTTGFGQDSISLSGYYLGAT